MGNEQLSKHQEYVYSFLKQQVDNLADESRRDDARPRINQELLAARIELDDFVEDLMWAVKEYINDRAEGFSDWNKDAIRGMHDKKSFIWANSIVDSLERTRDSVGCTVEDIEYAEVES